jgi:small glutamine-rich tetratricopeptide repeat-containing protein alpha
LFGAIFSFIRTVQCIGEAFGVDPSNKEQSQTLSVKPASLQSIFDVFIKTRDKIPSEPQPVSSQSSGPSANDKVEAEKHKQAGNAQMTSKDYDAAIESYNKAVSLDSTNAVYYSNRAAAYSCKGDHLAALGDAEKAISVDPKFVRAYHRLGYVPSAGGLNFFFHFASPDMRSILWETSKHRRVLLNEASNLSLEILA